MFGGRPRRISLEAWNERRGARRVAPVFVPEPTLRLPIIAPSKHDASNRNHGKRDEHGSRWPTQKSSERNADEADILGMTDSSVGAARRQSIHAMLLVANAP